MTTQTEPGDAGAPEGFIEPQLDTYTAVGLAEGFIEAESEEQVIAAWQYLHDTGVAYQLQGWFGRTARDLIDNGIITE